MQAATPTSDAAIRRAEQADPNGCRCLVENCPKERAVELAYVYDRENSSDTTTMTSIEWAWGLRKGTLNLDTRHNIFFLGASMKALYRAGLWALLPSEGIVDQYLTKPRGKYLGTPLSRKSFPTISGTTFDYKFLPLSDMSTFGITRQDATCDPCSEAAYKTHVYPFESLPTLTSHVHPNFALLHLSTLLVDHMGDPYIANLIKSNTLIAKVSRLSMGWCSPALPERAKYDATFVSNPPLMKREVSAGGSVNSDEDDSDGSQYDDVDLGYQTSEGDSTCTPPRRVRYLPTPLKVLPQVQSAKRSSEELNQEDHAGDHVSKPGKRRKIYPLNAREGPVRVSTHSAADSDSAWTKEAISNWARECSASPELPDSLHAPPSTTDGV